MFKRFNNLNLGHKINLGFAALVLVLLFVVALIFNAGNAATEKINLTVDVRVPTTLAATDAQSNLLKMQAAVRGYLAVSDLQQIDDYNQAKARFQENLAQLNTLSLDWTNAEETNRLNQLIKIFAEWLPIPDELFALHDNPLANQPGLSLETITINPRMNALLSAIDQLTRGLQLQALQPEALQPETPQRDPQTERQTSAWQLLLAELTPFRTSLDGMNTNLSAYAATGNLIFKYRYSSELVTNSTHLDAILTILESAPLDPSIQRAVDNIVAQRSEILGLSSQLFSAVEGEQSYLDQYLFKRQMVPETEEMLRLLESLAHGQQTLLQSELNDGKRSLAGLRYQTILGGVIVLLLGAAMVYIFRRNIAKPIHRLSRTAERIGAGNLQARAPVETTDEIGQLATTFNHMTAELDQTFQALAQAKETAETANRAKSRFLASMSHELRTPLNAILGYVQILGRDKTLNPPQQNGLSVIESNGEHLLGFINDILDLSKIEASKLELLPSEIDLPAFLHQIALTYKSRALEDPSVDFLANLSPALPTTIEADEVRLRQILLNLLENAFKFTARGSVTFTADLVETHNEMGLAQLRFVVADTGIGMTEADRATIFRPFEQVCDAKQRAKGVGLGLAITQELVYAMDAALTVQSAPDEGSIFTFTCTVPTHNAKGTTTAAPSATLSATSINSSTHSNGSTRPTPNQKPASASHTNDNKSITTSPSTSSTTPSPDPTELAIMLDMARKGELPKLQHHVETLAAHQPRYEPFAHKILHLIREYEEEQLVEMLEIQ